MLKRYKNELKIGIMLLVLGGIIYFILLIKKVLLPFVFGTFLAYLFNPLITFLRKRNISRITALYILILVVLILFISISIFILPIFIRELEELTVTLPKYVNSLEKYVEYVNREYRRIHLPEVIKEVIDQALAKLENFILNFIENLTTSVINSLTYIVSLFISPIITYYILKDYEEIQSSFLNIVPKKYRKPVLKSGREISKIFVGFLRGQIWVSIIVGVFSTLGLMLFKVKFYLLLGILAGITNMIPYFGPVIGAIPAVMIAFLSSPVKAFGVIILFSLIQQVESSIIGPKIFSNRVGLHPLTIIFVLLAGADIFDGWGLIFAVPVAGSLKVIFKIFIEQIISIKGLSGQE
ncbi:AI-2E family transporter [Halothermothrix orenii]|uniref:Predicted permease n=1 Tax=Halothermothrix orenii (strain H 168 / OCM 544 / DSM 9562) TaxID=373903 RepID=B8D2A4_HALOH|nr:AI-2E family transporter [Halothermothrix orenii]ACL69331.1 predicted permease [Halothermothrix orenii H 168]